ncbi:MAG TPA: hypothetical protein VMA86_00520 [Acetobacteraceae bacterium]|nr:hypothetical protein [Acetobacteraceae bacterium]
MSGTTNGGDGGSAQNGSGQSAPGQGGFYSLSVPYNTDQVAYARLGAPDTASEGTLPSNPGDPGGGKGASYGAGIVLYATGSIKQASPSVTQTSSEKLTVVQSKKGVLTSAQLVTSESDVGVFPTTINVNRGVTYTNTLGATLTSFLGASTAVTAGAQFQTVLASQQKFSWGYSVDVSGGQSIKIAAGSAEVQGLAAYKTVKTQSTNAGESITLAVDSNPAQTALYASAKKVEAWNYRVGLILAAVGTTLSLVGLGNTLVVGTSTSQESDIKDAMFTNLALMTTSAALSVLLQVASILFVAAMRLKHKITLDDATATQLKLEPASIKLATPGKIRIDAGAADSVLEIVCNGKITLLANEIALDAITSLTVSSNGTLNLTGQQISLSGNQISLAGQQVSLPPQYVPLPIVLPPPLPPAIPAAAVAAGGDLGADAGVAQED